MHVPSALILAVGVVLVGPGSAPGQLDYADSPSGLQTPQMEGATRRWSLTTSTEMGTSTWP